MEEVLNEKEEIFLDALAGNASVLFITDGEGAKIQFIGVNGTLLEIPSEFIRLLARPRERKDRAQTVVDTTSPPTWIHG